MQWISTASITVYGVKPIFLPPISYIYIYSFFSPFTASREIRQSAYANYYKIRIIFAFWQKKNEIEKWEIIKPKF